MSSTGLQHNHYQQRPSNPDAKALQERLHELISRVADSIEIVKSWPESSGDDASIHVKTTSKLIASIRDILSAITRVEGVVQKKSDKSNSGASTSAVGDKNKTTNSKNDGEESELWKTLQQCPIPLDLLEMLDCSNGLNPEIFVRGLLREALSQLAGLRRRKVALEMLGNAIQSGLDVAHKKATVASTTSKIHTTTKTDVKRGRDEDDSGGQEGASSSQQPPSKKANYDESRS